AEANTRRTRWSPSICAASASMNFCADAWYVGSQRSGIGPVALLTTSENCSGPAPRFIAQVGAEAPSIGRIRTGKPRAHEVAIAASSPLQSYGPSFTGCTSDQRMLIELAEIGAPAGATPPRVKMPLVPP